MNTMTNHYDVLGLPQDASKTDIVRAFNHKMLWLNDSKEEVTGNRYEKINQVLQSFSALYSNDARYSSKKNLKSSKLSMPTVLINSSYDLIEDVIEIFKLRWRYVSIYPAELVIKKIIIDIVSRILFSCIGIILSIVFVICILHGNPEMAAWPNQTESIPRELKLFSIIFAIIFFFARDIYLMYKYK